MEAAARPASGPGRALLVLVLAVGAVTALAVFAGDGSAPVPLAVALPALVAAWLVGSAALLGRLDVSAIEREARLVVGGAAALTAWAGVSITWSIAGDRSWQWLDRGLVLLAFLVLGLLVGATPGAVRLVTAALAAVVGASLGWALLGLALPALAPDGDRVARLQEPVGYWNALALLADAGLALAAWLLAERRPALRGAGALLGFAAAAVVLVTQSRAGVLTAAAVVALVLVRSARRLELGLALLLAALPGLAVGAWVFTRPALVDDGVGRAARVDEAPLAALVLVLGGAVAVVLVAAVPVAALVERQRASVARVLRAAAAALVLAGLVGLVAAVGNPVDWARDQVGAGECANTPGRLTELCDNNRLAWWGNALEIARDDPLGGSGAGTYELARLGVRGDGTPVTEPHSVPLQLLSDLGLVGLGLGLLTGVAAVLGVRRALRRLGGDDAWPATVLAALPLAWGLHALVDYDLDLVAVTGPALLAVGILLAAPGPIRRPRGGAPAVAVAAGVVLLAGVSIVAPALARSAVDEVYAAPDLATAADAARRARSLDPLSLEPVLAQAFVADQAGDRRRAQELLEHATRMQPENPGPWLELARFHYAAVPREYCAAYEAFNEAYTLDPKSARWVPGGPLDVSRDRVNAGACEQ